LNEMTSPGPTQSLAEFAHSVRADGLPEAVISKVSDLIVDTVGCALAGWASEEVPQVAAGSPSHGVGGSTIIGHPGLVPALNAVFVNAYLATAITACDVYTPAHCHLTPEVIPVGLAVGEQARSSGSELLTAVAVGLEVAARVARSLDFGEFRSRGWHAPGIVGPIGAAVTVARLLRLEPDGIRTAMSLAVSQAAGTQASWPTAAVKFHQARGAVSGLTSGYLAQQGFEAALEPLEAPDGGLFASYAPGDAGRALDGLGSDWELTRISLRLWPGATTLQSLLSVLLSEDAALPDPAALERMTIRVPERTYDSHIGVSHPTGTFEALLSFHHVAAVVLLARSFDVGLAGPVWRADAQVRFLAENVIELRADAVVPIGGVVVELVTKDGRSRELRLDHALGTPANPASHDDVDKKFARNARTRLSDTDGEAMLVELRGLAEIADCRDLIAGMGRRSRGPTSTHIGRQGGVGRA
jgi:2-methylcitrate dehydratase PrpD